MRCPAPAVAASVWQCLSAPARPPKSAPLPLPALVTKKLIGDCGGIVEVQAEVANGRGDTPNQHDILTGSTPDGRATEATCNNWTSSSNGSAIVGHHDRSGLDDSAPAKSWNASHPSRACSDEALVSTGGVGLLYCFAVN